MRELRNVVESLPLMADVPDVRLDELSAGPAGASAPATRSGSLGAAKHAAIVAAIRACQGILTLAAHSPRVFHNTLYRKMGAVQRMIRCLFLLVLLGFAPSAHAQFMAPVAEVPDGSTLFRRQCATCHSLVAGEARQGPNLAGVYGRPAGSLPGFAYSAGFKEADWVWDDTHLDPYLANPQAVIKGGVMGYRQSNADVRHTIIAYLKDQH